MFVRMKAVTYDRNDSSEISVNEKQFTLSAKILSSCLKSALLIAAKLTNAEILRLLANETISKCQRKCCHKYAKKYLRPLKIP